MEHTAHHVVEHRRYAVEDFNQVDPTLGTNEELSRLAAAMRRRGMSLCLDFVINHTA